MKQYAKFFHEKWWTANVKKYGIAEFKLAAIGDDGQPLKSVLRAGNESQDSEIFRAFRSRHTVRWMLSTASPLLRKAGHVVLERFLKLATSEAASSKVLRRRLFYDRRNWDNKFAHLQSLFESATMWYRSLDLAVQSHLHPTYSFQNVQSVADEMDSLSQLARSTVGILKELVRAVVQENAYAAHINQLYLRQDVTFHHAIYDKYLAHLEG